MSKVKDRNLIDEVHDVMRLHHYSIHSEWSYFDWIKRFVLFHKMTEEGKGTLLTKLTYYLEFYKILDSKST